jgi:hypothetical protein
MGLPERDIISQSELLLETLAFLPIRSLNPYFIIHLCSVCSSNYSESALYLVLFDSGLFCECSIGREDKRAVERARKGVEDCGDHCLDSPLPLTIRYEHCKCRSHRSRIGRKGIPSSTRNSGFKPLERADQTCIRVQFDPFTI